MEAFRNADGWIPRVNVQVLKVTSPTCFFIREATGLQMSQSTRDFVGMEANMEQYLRKQEPLSSTRAPDIGCVVLFKKQTGTELQRARVDKIIDLPGSYQVEVTLVDYGQTLLVDRKQLHKASRKILKVPFQCIKFSLLGLRPLHCATSEARTSVEHVPKDSWDDAATEYVKTAIESANSVQVEVLGQTVSGGLYGKLHIECKKKVISLDEELVSLNYAFLDSDAGSEEILLEDHKSLLGTSTDEQYMTHKAVVSITTKSSSDRKNHHQKKTSAALPKVHDVQVSSSSTEANPPSKEPPPASTSTKAASCLSEAPCALASLCEKPNIVNSMNVNAEKRDVLVLAQSHEVESCASTLAIALKEGAEQGTDTWETVSLTSEGQQGSSIECHSSKEEDMPGIVAEERKQKPLKQLATAPVPNKVSPPELHATELKGFGNGTDKAHNLPAYPSARSSVVLLQATLPPSTIMTRAQSSKPVNTQDKKPVQGRQHEFSSQCMSAGRNRLQTSRKTLKLWDVLKKRGSALSEAHLQNLRSTFKKPQVTDKLTSHVKPDETTEKTASCEKDEALTPTSNVNPSTTEPPSCVNSAKSQPTSEKTASNKTADESIDYSDFMSPCHIVEEIVDPDVEEAKWNLKFDTEVADLAAINVCQAPEDFRHHDFQSFSEVPQELDPYAEFEDAPYFSADFDSCKLPAQLANSKARAVCHGSIAPQPITHLDKTCFDASLKERLRSLGFRRPSCIQSVVWPAVSTGRNVVAVATPHTGKTLAYLIPLVSRMLTEIDYHQLPTGCGPLMLILTSTWQGAHRIYEQVNLLVEENAKCPKCCILYAGGSEDGKEIPIINGCDILVATPHSFLRFLNNYERLIVNMYRCCHLVLDDGERLLDTFTAEVTAVLEEFLECQKKRQSCLKFAQIIVCSTMWTSGLDWFLRTYIVQQTPLVILSSFSEAAIYAAVPTLACYVEPHAQNDALLNIVKGNASRKVVVCAAERETAIAAHHLLVSQDLYSLLLHDELPVAKISEVSSEWTSEHTKVDMPILVIQDKVLPLTNIRDADVLVHYDIPELSQFNFGFRYSCIADHMRSFRDKDDFYTSERPVVHMILSSNNRSISVQLVEFLNRLGSKVPDGLAQLASEEKEMRVSSSAELPLCPNLKAFGRCERQSSESGCSYRHQILPETDHAPCWSYLPSQGSVRIAITKVTSASHFYAQILQQWNKPSGPASGNEPEVKENLELQEAKSLLNEYFSNVENRVPFDAKATPTVGQVYGLEASANQYERVLVTSVTSSNSAPASVTVTHLDYGGHSTVSASRLFHLPPKLTMIRPLAVEVYCCGMQPPDGDLSWTFQADFRAHNLFFRKELVGEIVLRLGNTLWLDRLVFQEKLRFAGTRVSLQNMRTTLVKEGFANTNPSHMERLRKMATDAGVTVPALPAEVEGPSSLNNRLDTTLKHPCTTHLDTMDYNHVFLWKVMSPSHFYVQPCKFITNLDELEKNIENAVRRQTLKKLKSVHTGVLCIARCSNNGWYRGEVKEILNDEEVVVSFHDYGDFETCCVNNLLEPLPWMLLLPYQALSCSLAGIGPTSGEWSPKAQSVLEDFGYDKDFNRALCLRVAKKKAGDRPGTSHYEVFLFDSCSSGRIGANDVLVKQGLAVPTEVPELDFDISVPHESFQKDEVVLESESDDENDSVISDSKKFQKEYELCSLRYALQEIFTQVHSEDDTVSDEEAEDEAATELPIYDPGHGRNKFTDKYGVCPSKAIAVDLENKKQSHKEGSSMYVNSESLPTATSSSAKSCVDDSSCENGGGVYVSKATSAAVDFMSHSESTIPSDNTSLSSTKDKDATVVASTLHQCTNKKPASKKKKKTKRAARVSWKDAVKDGLQTLDSQFKTESSRQPTVSWWQDRNFVHLDVSVMNVPEYKLNLTASMLCLRITTEKQEFLLHEKLYAAIEPTQSNITVKLKSLALKLKKAKGELNWKALTRHKQKMPYIRYDLDHVGLNNSDDDIIIACEACKDPSYTGPDPTTKVLPYDPVAHKERTLDIEAAKVIDDFPDEVYYNLDPNNIFEDLD